MKQFFLLIPPIHKENPQTTFLILTFKAFFAASASERLSKLTKPTGWRKKENKKKKKKKAGHVYVSGSKVTLNWRTKTKKWSQKMGDKKASPIQKYIWLSDTAKFLTWIKGIVRVAFQGKSQGTRYSFKLNNNNKNLEGVGWCSAKHTGI